MQLRILLLALLVLVVLPNGGVQAQVLPPPRAVQMEMYAPRYVIPPSMTGGVLPPHGKPIPTLPLAASPVPPPGYQPSAYQVWQNYGVTRSGWIVPRVIQTPRTGYFLYSGAPYPYVYVLPGYHMPSVALTGAPGT